jgi:hypothetical protein
MTAFHGDPIDYLHKLYTDLFANYRKETGPWKKATATDGGSDVVTVIFDAMLMKIESLVGARNENFIE